MISAKSLQSKLLSVVHHLGNGAAEASGGQNIF
jgi:hypothetical protein